MEAVVFILSFFSFFSPAVLRLFLALVVLGNTDVSRSPDCDHVVAGATLSAQKPVN